VTIGTNIDTDAHTTTGASNGNGANAAPGVPDRVGPEASEATGDAVPGPHPPVDPEGENTTVDVARIGWLATVVACLIAVVILVLQGYFGYAGVTLAVAISAAINLT
jgi:hypothetical protein